MDQLLCVYTFSEYFSELASIDLPKSEEGMAAAAAAAVFCAWVCACSQSGESVT